MMSGNANDSFMGVGRLDHRRTASVIGFVGLGRMGAAMAANLAAGGRRGVAYVRHPEQVNALVAHGLVPTTNISNLFDCEIVISMLPDDDAVREVALGGEGPDFLCLASRLKPGAIHLSM